MTRHRRLFAATAALLWLLGVEVLPNLHLAAHHDDHTHAADGSIVLVEDHHDHDVEHEHEHAHHDDHRDAIDHDQPVLDTAPSRHAATGLAHRELALHEPSPPVLAPHAVPQPEAWTHATPNPRITIAERARPTARGPPQG